MPLKLKIKLGGNAIPKTSTTDSARREKTQTKGRGRVQSRSRGRAKQRRPIRIGKPRSANETWVRPGHKVDSFGTRSKDDDPDYHPESLKASDVLTKKFEVTKAVSQVESTRLHEAQSQEELIDIEDEETEEDDHEDEEAGPEINLVPYEQLEEPKNLESLSDRWKVFQTHSEDTVKVDEILPDYNQKHGEIPSDAYNINSDGQQVKENSSQGKNDSENHLAKEEASKEVSLRNPQILGRIQQLWEAAQLQLNLQKERQRRQEELEKRLQQDRERQLEAYSMEAKILAEKRKKEEEDQKLKAKTQAQVERELERAREREKRKRLERTVNMDEQNLVMSGYQNDP